MHDPDNTSTANPASGSWDENVESPRRRQRGVMLSDFTWDRVSRAAKLAGMEKSRYVEQELLKPKGLPPEVLRRVIRQALTLAMLEERRLREAGLGHLWDEVSDAVDDWIDEEGVFEQLTDPGAANRWKAVSRSDRGGADPS